MKTLNLLVPNRKSGYLSNGRGQEVNYIDLSPELTMDALEHDVKNGAVQFEELLEFARKKPSRFVVINAANEEDGIMAASYLAGIYNHLEDMRYEEDDSEVYLGEVKDFGFGDVEDFDILDNPNPDWEDQEQWEENPWRIPVIDMGQIARGESFSPSFAGDNVFSNNTRRDGMTPYWHYTRQEPIIITYDPAGRFYYGGFGGCDDIAKMCKRYKNNRHVYLVRTVPEDEPDEPLPMMGIDNDEILEFILEYSAGVVSVSMEKEARELYHEVVLRNLLKEGGYSTVSKFPFKKIVRSIEKNGSTEKNALMAKIVRYLDKEECPDKVISEKNLDFLKDFIQITEKKADKKGLQRLEKELVGMDDVKEQILGIVEVMKYNKRRQELGFGAGSFHNVHMLLGAPGTAKTTVAEILGRIMAEEKLLRGNRFLSVNGAELKAMYVGQTAPKVKAMFDQYDIILIDEAYAVASSMSGEMDIYGQEAISQLIIELEKHGMDRLVLFAGYGGKHVSEKDNKMKEFLEANPGIRSRINTTIFFDSYSPEEMLAIFQCHAKNGKFSLDKRAYGAVLEFFKTRVGEKDFGNGREARSLLENTSVEAAKRLAKISSERLNAKMYQELTLEDVERAIVKMKKAYETQKGSTKINLGFLM